MVTGAQSCIVKIIFDHLFLLEALVMEHLVMVTSFVNFCFGPLVGVDCLKAVKDRIYI